MAGAGRTSSRDAGTTAASLGVAPTAANISVALATGFLGGSSANSSEQSGEGGEEKIKGRLVAAAKKNGEADIIYSIFKGTWDQSARATFYVFRFVFAKSSMRLRPYIVNRLFRIFR
jgi:hypothetical protein